jgi:hypothetical protein
MSSPSGIITAMSDPKKMLDGFDPELAKLLEPLLLAHETGFNHTAGPELHAKLARLSREDLMRIAGHALAMASAQTLRVDRLEELVTKLKQTRE